jgi:hypothetical protein
MVAFPPHLTAALETGGEGMAACPPLLALVRDDLCLAILKMTKGGYTVEVRLREEKKSI